MADTVSPPNVRTLLPPLLACLPTSSASPRPPPALLRLLSPILRQRVQLLSASAESPTESWLPLLCWNREAAERLPGVVEREAFELHPVSGEVEYGEVGPIGYKRLDEESLHAKVEIRDLELTILYTWVQEDPENTGCSWLVTEVLPLNHESQSAIQEWYPSIITAEEHANQSQGTPENSQTRAAPSGRIPQINGAVADEEDDEDDDYWAQYDKTPGRTPAANRSPMRRPDSSTERRGRSASEAAYFERYSGVQPEMDNDDPSQDRSAIGTSSLNGNVVTGSINQGAADLSQQDGANKDPAPVSGEVGSSGRRPSFNGVASECDSRLHGSRADPTASETAIKQHVSTSIKSLFRLCRGAGIERPEFEEMINTELETLSLMTEDD